MTDPKATDPSIQSGSYALNSLDADEKLDFENHLAASRGIRDEVTELTDTAVLLGLAVTPEAPPASLKASIMSQLDATPQLAPEAPLIGSAERRARARWTARPATALAAAAAVIGILAGGGVLATTFVENQQREQQASQLAAINAADDVQSRSIDTEFGAATLVWSAELASSALLMDGLDPLPANLVYELWYINDAGARSAGTFTVTAGETWRVLDGPLNVGDVVGVTVEPRGGSEAPTTDPIVLIESA